MKYLAATNNEGKLIEIKRILKSCNIEVVTLAQCNINVEVEETGSTFLENAVLKARAYSELSGLPTIADDSGLIVDALNGEPGVYSARYAGAPQDAQRNLLKLLENMKNIPPQNRSARYYCAIAVIDEKGELQSYQASCEGAIGYSEIGQNGFGYDPIFMVGERSMAQLSNEEKDAISHRALALKQFEKTLKERYAAANI